MEKSKTQNKVKDKKKEPKESELAPREKDRDEGRHNFYLSQSRYDEYTPLTAKRDTILKEVYNAQLIRLLRNAGKQKVPPKLIGKNGVNSIRIMATPQKTAPL